MNVTMVDHTINPEDKVASFSAVCYGSKTDDKSNARRIKKLMDVKHLATLRFANATFLVEGVSRACTHQLVRHPHLSYLQESQRYVKQSETKFVTPPNYRDDVNDIFHRSFQRSLDDYLQLLSLGVKKEDARYVLPEATESKMYITGNMQAWTDFLHNRLESHAQWEIKDVAKLVHENVSEVAPNVFGGIDGNTY